MKVTHSLILQLQPLQVPAKTIFKQITYCQIVQYSTVHFSTYCGLNRISLKLEFDIGTTARNLWLKPLTFIFGNWRGVFHRIPSSTHWCMTRHRRPCWLTKERSEWGHVFRQTYLKCYKRVSQNSVN